MTYKTLCEIFLLALLGISCARIFFIKVAHQDPLSVIPIITFILSLLSLLAFGLSLNGILITLLAFIVSLWNANALSRFTHKLVVDHYGMMFTLASIVNIILVIVLIVFTVLYCPAKINMKKYGVKITPQTYSGTLANGFSDYTSPTQSKSIFIKKYTTINEKENPFEESRTIVFIPNEFSSTDLYEPFLVKLAHDGYTVYSAEFYSKDIRWFNNAWDFKPLRRFAILYCKLKKPELYSAITAQKPENFTKEILTLVKILPISKSDRIFIVGDGESQAAYTAASIAENGKIKGSFDLSSISSYTTPGFGPVESTEPILAKYLGINKDKTFYMSSHIAGILEKAIDENLNPTKIKLPTETEESTEEAESSESSRTEE